MVLRFLCSLWCQEWQISPSRSHDFVAHLKPFVALNQHGMKGFSSLFCSEKGFKRFIVSHVGMYQNHSYLPNLVFSGQVLHFPSRLSVCFFTLYYVLHSFVLSEFLVTSSVLHMRVIAFIVVLPSFQSHPLFLKCRSLFNFIPLLFFLFSQLPSFQSLLVFFKCMSCSSSLSSFAFLKLFYLYFKPQRLKLILVLSFVSMNLCVQIES